MDFYELGKELATLRKSKNISQQTLAKDLHISGYLYIKVPKATSDLKVA